MSEKYILYNPCAGGPETEKAVKALQDANEGLWRSIFAASSVIRLF